MTTAWLRPIRAILAVVLLSGCGGGDRGTDDPPAGTGAGVADRECTGALGAETVPGDLTVPSGATCRLNGTAVLGRVLVDSDASLLARSAHLGEGVSAHGFDRVEIVEGRRPGRDPGPIRDDIEKEVDFVFDGGRHVTVTDGYEQGHYYLLDNTGRVVLEGLYLDLGSIFCAGNRHPPEVSRISAEGVGHLQGQCAGLRHFDPNSDF